MFELNYPPHVRFGWGVRKDLPAVIQRLTGSPVPRYALVVGRSAHYNAFIAECEGLLGKPQLIYRDIRPDPVLANVDGLIAKLRSSQPELVIGCGGGSVMDTAKAGAALAPLGGNTIDYFYGKRSIDRRGIPFIAMPTTAGTGAEVTKNSVLTDPDTLIKQSIRDPRMVAVAALIDPELTLTLPPAITASSGLDALTQALESYICTRANSVSRALAARAIELIFPSLPVVYEDGENREHRTLMAEGSLLSAMAFSQSGLGAVHGLAHPLGAMLDVQHGLTCAILLPYILEFNASVSSPHYAELGAQLGLGGAQEFIDAIRALCDRLNVPSTFSDHGLQAKHSDFIIANCRSNSMKANPREISDTQVENLLAALR